jgi:hypothetical protein
MYSQVPGSPVKTHAMTDFGSHSPRRYFADHSGRRVLIGLTIEETSEFETLDGLSAFDETGNQMTWHEHGIPTAASEKRWLELYSKHDAAWKQWAAESSLGPKRKFTLY